MGTYGGTNMRFVLVCSVVINISIQQALVGQESFVTRNIRNAVDGEKEEEIKWAEVDDLPPEWDRVESGIDDLLSLSTTYWEPGLGPRAPRRVPGDNVETAVRQDFNEHSFGDLEPGATPSSPQLNKLMHQAMATVNHLLHDLEKDKGEKKILPKKATRNVTLAALLIEEVTKRLTIEFSLNPSEVGSKMEGVPIKDTMLSDMCPDIESAFCFPHKYRTINGECNNVKNPTWGITGAAYLRILQPMYQDGVGSPRDSGVNGPLPDALYISSRVLRERDVPHEHLTGLTAIWGQLVSHDIAYTLPISGFSECCEAMFRDETHPECLPVVMQNYSCQGYVRSAIGLKPGCLLGPREQMNFGTAYIDGSGIYGATPESADKLREFEGGFLKVDPGNLLPEDEYNPNCRLEVSGGRKCLRSGDERVNDNAGLASLHTVLVREHNRIASLLETVNPHWDEETLYQESRKIVGAEIQHITYNEFLPAILGEVLTETFQLKSKGNGYHMDYNDELPTTTLNSVGNAVLQFIPSLLPGELEFFSPNGEKKGDVAMNSTYWAPFPAHNTREVQELAMGLINSKAQKVDLNMAPGTKHYLGSDKMATIIQTGRDHGLPTYTQVREYCGLPSISSFAELNNTIDDDIIDLLESVYSHHDDIDLVVGGLSERPLSGAVVGPTFGCLLGQQFQILKKGDRFWYENNIPPSAFTKDQLQELRKVNLASILCENLDGVYMVQPDVFIGLDPYLNSPVTCDVFPRINIELWKTDSPALQVPEAILIQTLEKGTEGLAIRRKEEFHLWQRNMGAHSKSAQGTAFAFSRPNREALLLSNTSLLLEYTSRVFLNSLQETGEPRIRRQVQSENSLNSVVNINEFANGLTNIDVTRVVSTVPIGSLAECHKEENHSPCDHTYKYRNFNGWCNNLNSPQYGKSISPLLRFLPAQYDDAISRPRFRSVGSKPLPSPRLVSIVVHADVSHLHSRYTLMLMQFGQFLDHDITLTPVNKGVRDIILDCRACDSSQTVHPECWPIPVPRNDPYFPALNISSGRPHCIAFTRSLPGQQRLGPREQLNQNTAFLDSSQIYGQNICSADSLREFENGRLNMTTPSHGRGKNLMPTTTKNDECKAESGKCFVAGDTRASEQPALAAMHTIYLREHNRIAGELQRLNPHWGDERLFQEGRRIMGAMNQHITYNEFLPRIIGLNAMNLYDLRVRTEGYSTDYDPTCNPSIFNEFATAAFRFGHSLIRPMLTRMSDEFKVMDSHIRLRDGFFNPDMLYQTKMIDEMMRGLVSTPMENQDQFMSGEVTNHLFEEKSIPKSGLDLAALNIQRGRDHGLKSYNEYRVACNLKRAHNFDDLAREINQDVIKRLKQIYFSVEDIDLFTGGLSEVPLKGALVGPTFACIIGIQFQKIKKCDRMWYENSEASVRFTEAQLTEIRKTTLAKVICENCDVVDKIQKSVFDQYHEFLNERVPCRTLPELNLQLWKDEAHKCKVDGIDIPLGASRRISPCTSCTCTRENAECQSLRVNNCRQLIAEVGVEAVRRDNICKTQCSFALNSPSPVSNIVTTDGALTAPLPPTPQRPVNAGPTIPIPSVPSRPGSPIRPIPPPPPRPPLRPGFTGSSSTFFTAPTGGRPGSIPVSGTPIVPLGKGPIPVGAVPNHRQPRPLFTFPSIRLPNLSDLFGL